MTTFLLALLFGSPTVDLAAVGDLMLGRYVGRRIEKAGVDSVFAGASAELRKADIAFGNLECVLSDKPLRASKRVLLRASPWTASGLARAGFDVLSVANNHALDAGAEGLSDTIAHLTKAGISPLGVSRKPLVVFRNGLKIAFVAYCDFSGESGISYVDDRLRSDIEAARKVADVVVVSFHWGDELTNVVNRRQVRVARLAAKAGADVVLGHHPHVLQKIVWIAGVGGRRCLVGYSLGNFVFDSKTAAEKQTGILHVTLSKAGAVSYSFARYEISNGVPAKANRPESELSGKSR